MFFQVVFVLTDVEFRKRQILFEIVAALFRSRTRDFTLETDDEVAHFNHRRQYVVDGQISEKNDITPRTSAHRAEVNDVGFYVTVAQVGCAKVFNGM